MTKEGWLRSNDTHVRFRKPYVNFPFWNIALVGQLHTFEAWLKNKKEKYITQSVTSVEFKYPVPKL